MNRLWTDFADIVAAAAADPESVRSEDKEKVGPSTRRIATGPITAAIEEAVTENDRPKLQA